jgi:hypothetical protein
MSNTLPEFLALLNDVLQAVIVIFGSAVVLYHIGRSLRARVMLAFCALISFVVIVYLTELLVSRTIITNSSETWLRLSWVGIAMVPAAQYHLSDALLEATGASASRRKGLVPLFYFLGLIFLSLVLWTDYIVADLVPLKLAPHLEAGPFFVAFAFYFWTVTAVSIVNVWRARQRAIISTTRQRLTTTLLSFLAAPLGVFPYLMLTGNSDNSIPLSQEMPLLFWPVVILGNLVVSAMFGVLTAHLAYFGADSPDRVVRVRLYKFMARVPLAGTIVLLVYVLVSRSSPILGLPTETALGFALVATVMLVEWAIHVYKRPLERLFQLDDDPDVRRIQKLSERLVTTRELRQFLESILAATCEALRTPNAFVAALTQEGPKLEAMVGPINESDDIFEDPHWREIAYADNANNEQLPSQLPSVNGFILWHNYWIRPLYDRNKKMMLGIFGIRARAENPDLTEEETAVLEKLISQAANALEDRVLQQEVFAAVEGLLPQITALQQKRTAAEFGGLPLLTEEELVNDPNFTSMVRDALSHYWGGPKLTESPLMQLNVVQKAMEEHGGNPTSALRAILANAIELQKPEGERKMTTAEWILYNILELKFVQGVRVRDVARRLAMSESDFYRKQRVAIENVAKTIAKMELNTRSPGEAEEQKSRSTEETP